MQPASLARLYVFNPLFGPDEDNEDKKVLFFHPDTLRIGLQLREIGLTQAFINFSLQYKAERPCEFVHTQKTRRVIIQAEPDFWIVMIANNSSFKKSKDEEVWREDELDDNMLVSILQNSYDLFKLFYGPMHLMEEETLRRSLKEFYGAFVQTIDIEKSDIFTTLNAVRYVHIDSAVSLEIVSLANHLFDEIPAGDLVVFFRDQVVYSALNPSNTRLINGYVNRFILSGNPLTVPPRSRYTKQEIGGSTIFTWQSTYSNGIPGYMTLVQRGEWTAVIVGRGLFVSEASAALRSLVVKNLPLIQEQVLDHISTSLRLCTVEETIKFMLFDNTNFELITSNCSPRLLLTKEALKIINTNHFDFIRSDERHHEMLVKTSTDLWVFSKKVLDRELFVVIENKEPDLMAARAKYQTLSDRLFRKEIIL